MVLSLQGCMAVGKTTAARAAAARDPSVTVFFEDNTEVVQALRLHRWDKHRFEDYCEIQRLFIAHEVRRFEQACRCPCALLDLGADPNGLDTPESWSYIKLLNGKILPVSPMDCALLSGQEDCQQALELFGGVSLHENLPS